MNLCILHKYLNHNILCYKATIPTIYSCATRSARFAVSRALTAHPTKDRCCALACHVARISQSDGLFCTVRLNAPSSQRFFYFLCILHKNKCQKLRKFVHILVKLWFFGSQPQYVVDFDTKYSQKPQHIVVSPGLQFGSKPVILSSKTKVKQRSAQRLLYRFSSPPLVGVYLAK